MEALIGLSPSCPSGVVTAQEIAGETGVEVRTVRRHLARRAERGEVLKVGTTGPDSGWTLPLTPEQERRIELYRLVEMRDGEVLPGKVALDLGLPLWAVRHYLEGRS
jgi:hypothetical protein